MLQADTMDHVHHMLVYKCHDLTSSPAANISDVCDNVHPEITYCYANVLIGGWAVGAGVRNIVCVYDFVALSYLCAAFVMQYIATYVCPLVIVCV